jgi:hypothetical protein
MTALAVPAHRSRERRSDEPRRPTVLSPARPKPVEIVAPDRYCADLLLGDAAQLFSGELVPGPGWVVRVQPPAGVEGVLEVLALVVHWLDSIPLSCAAVFHDGSTYLLRGAATDTAAKRSASGAPTLAAC